jgi:hypothetical protein
MVTVERTEVTIASYNDEICAIPAFPATGAFYVSGHLGFP